MQKEKVHPNIFLVKQLSGALGTDTQSSQFILAFRECKQIRWISFLFAKRKGRNRGNGEISVHVTHTHGPRVRHSRLRKVHSPAVARGEVRPTHSRLFLYL